MKKLLLIISVVAFCFLSCEQNEALNHKLEGSKPSSLSSSGWKQVALFPEEGRIAAFGLNIGNKGYVGTLLCTHIYCQSPSVIDCIKFI